MGIWLGLRKVVDGIFDRGWVEYWDFVDLEQGVVEGCTVFSEDRPHFIFTEHNVTRYECFFLNHSKTHYHFTILNLYHVNHHA